MNSGKGLWEHPRIDWRQNNFAPGEFSELPAILCDDLRFEWKLPCPFGLGFLERFIVSQVEWMVGKASGSIHRWIGDKKNFAPGKFSELPAILCDDLRFEWKLPCPFGLGFLERFIVSQVEWVVVKASGNLPGLFVSKNFSLPPNLANFLRSYVMTCESNQNSHILLDLDFSKGS